jgi:catechol 2,3-dioxygenase-like lactoylglutathione lyase family enzyme
MKLAAVTYLVRDYDEAIQWFVDALGFELLEDVTLGDAKRWVRVAPHNSGTCLLLALAVGPEQVAAIGKAAGGRVAYFLHTDDFDRSYKNMKIRNVKFRETPRHEAYGTVAVFEDIYGNAWDLIEPKS